MAVNHPADRADRAKCGSEGQVGRQSDGTRTEDAVHRVSEWVAYIVFVFGLFMCFE